MANPPVVQDMKSQHRLMMTRIVTEGLTNKEAAIEFNMTPQNVSLLRRSPLWKAEEKKLVEDLQAEHKSRILNLVPKAIEALEEVVGVATTFERDGEQHHVMNPPATRVNAAGMILDRAGVKGAAEGGGSGKVSINLFKPGWDKGEGQMVEVEVKE